MPIIVALLGALLAIATFLLIRATRRLLEFDELWDDVTTVLIAYESDLRVMSSGDLSEVAMDHPEIITFHRRNLRALSDIEKITRSLKARKPAEQKAIGKRPVVE